MHILAPTVRIVPAHGKSVLLEAYDGLVGSGFDQKMFFLMDCDNDTPDNRKGMHDLAVTCHRDLEADLLFSLDAFDRVAIDFLSAVHYELSAIESVAERTLERALNLAAMCSVVRDAARSCALRVRFTDPHSGHRRVARPDDLRAQLPSATNLTLDLVANAMGGVIGWTRDEVQGVLAASPGIVSCPHTSEGCSACRLLTFCNGHDAVQALAYMLTTETGIYVGAKEVEAQLRVGLDRRRVEHWPVGKRIRKWESRTGVRLLRERF